MARDDSQQSTSWGKWFLAVVATAVVGVIVVLALIVASLQTSWGLEQSSRQLERTISQEIPGYLEVDALETLEFFSPVGRIGADARGVVFYNPDGSEVVRIDAAHIAFDMSAVSERMLHFEKADIDGGRVTVEPGREGLTKLENAFSSPAGDGGGGPKPFEIDMRAMHVEDMKLDILLESQTFELANIEGFVGIFQPRTAPGVTVKFDDMSAIMEKPSYLGSKADFQTIDGEILGNRKQVVDLDFTAAIFGGKIDGNFAYFPKKEKKVHLTLDPKDEITALSSLMADLRTEVVGGVVIELE